MYYKGIWSDHSANQDIVVMTFDAAINKIILCWYYVKLGMTFGSTDKMLAGKKYFQGVRALRLLIEELLRHARVMASRRAHQCQSADPPGGPPGDDRTQVGPCWPHEPCYQGVATAGTESWQTFVCSKIVQSATNIIGIQGEVVLSLPPSCTAEQPLPENVLRYTELNSAGRLINRINLWYQGTCHLGHPSMSSSLSTVVVILRDFVEVANVSACASS